MDFEVRKDRHGGGRRLTREREVYLQLTRQEYSSREACRIVGINRRTGKRWRNGHHSPTDGKPKPLIRVDTSASRGGPSRYLREEDRIYIADRLREKAAVRQSARLLSDGRPASCAAPPLTFRIRRAALDTRARGSSRTRSLDRRGFVRENRALAWGVVTEGYERVRLCGARSGEAAHISR